MTRSALSNSAAHNVQRIASTPHTKSTHDSKFAFEVKQKCM